MTANKMSDTVNIDVFFDFGCPYVYNAAVWLQKVKEDMRGKLAVNWKYFSLEQVNNQNGPDWKLWEQPEDYPSRGRRAFQATEAARRQSEAAFSHFHMALLRARHEQSRDIADVNTLMEVAESFRLEICHLMEQRQYVQEVKRPARPGK